MFNKLIADFVPYLPEGLVWQFSKKYIAGKKIDDAIRVSKELNQENCVVTLDILGEFIKTLDEAKDNRDEYIELIEEVEKTDVKGNYSLKPTMFGLLLDKKVCFNHIREIVKKASEYGNFVRVDMEDSPCTDMEIDMYQKLLSEFPSNVGLVLQSYLRRTHSDIMKMNAPEFSEAKLNYRLCKGIYVEPKEIAYKTYEETNEHFIDDLDYLLKNDIYAGIATHDIPLVEAAYKLIEKYQVKKDRYEFQMLYGVTPGLRKSIVDKGHKMRIYVPFGEHWFGYSTRRLKENPKIMNHLIKAMIVKG